VQALHLNGALAPRLHYVGAASKGGTLAQQIFLRKSADLPLSHLEQHWKEVAPF
jgi:hypothetical protein